jgi:hypothetical protein
MSIMLEQLADELTITPDELERRSLLAFVDREQRLAKMDIADLEDRYGVRTADGLVQRNDNVPESPGSIHVSEAN